MDWFDAKFDPWLPKPAEIPKLPKPMDPADFEQESKRYLASLEEKMARLKSRNRSREPTSKEIIQSLSAAKEAHMKQLVSASESPYISNHEYTGGVGDESRMAALQRRIHPEKTAVSKEELDVLVDNDLLKAVEENLGSTGAAASAASASSTQNSTEDSKPTEPSTATTVDSGIKEATEPDTASENESSEQDPKSAEQVTDNTEEKEQT